MQRWKQGSIQLYLSPDSNKSLANLAVRNDCFVFDKWHYFLLY